MIGRIYLDHFSVPKDSAFTVHNFCNGIRRYAQAAIIMGMNVTDCHSQFLIDYEGNGIGYGTVGEFVFNESGENRASEKIDHLNNNPEQKLIASPSIGNIRYEWPGVIRVPHSSGAEIILSNSGVPDDMDVTLVAAFAIGVNEISPAWSLENFDLNNQYSWGLRRAARFIMIAEALQFITTRYEQIIMSRDFQDWAATNVQTIPLSGILVDARKNLTL